MIHNAESHESLCSLHARSCMLQSRLSSPPRLDVASSSASGQAVLSQALEEVLHHPCISTKVKGAIATTPFGCLQHLNGPKAADLIVRYLTYTGHLNESLSCTYNRISSVEKIFTLTTSKRTGSSIQIMSKSAQGVDTTMVLTILDGCAQ